MVTNPQQIQTLELQGFAQRKHAIASFLDVECDLQFTYEGSVRCVFDMQTKEHTVQVTKFYGGVLELYVGMEEDFGAYVYKWFNKNTIKVTIFTSMRYFTDICNMPFEDAIEQIEGTLLANCNGSKEAEEVIIESVQEYINDTKKALNSVDKFNFPDASKN